MSMKLIAIGNRLMGDDGVALHIAERLSDRLKDRGIEVIIGETDFEYCLNRINEGDYLIILDATWFGIEPGTVTLNSLQDVYRLSCIQGSYSQHGYSLIKAMERYFKSIDGMVIGIEGSNFDFSLALSSSLEKQFNSICSRVEAYI
jgi:hydrogenase maturation protease